MRIEEKQAWLQRCRSAVFEQRELEEELRALTAERQRLAPRLRGVPETRQRQRAACDRQAEQVRRCAALREQTAAVVDALPDARLRRVLHRRYLLGQSWPTIAQELHTDERWIYRLHRRALNQLRLPPEELPPECTHSTEKEHVDAETDNREK